MLLLTPVETTPSDGAWRWALSSDGLSPDRQGQSSASELPADAECVLVVPVSRLSWQRVALPRLAPARLRAALDGLLEERLLDDPAQLHFALEPGIQPGRPGNGWVAICDKAWLKSQLQALEQAGRPATRIIPAASPQGSDSVWLEIDGEQTWCIAAGPAGLLALPLLHQPGNGDLALQPASRQWSARDDAPSASADAASLALAEASWPELKWRVASAPERWLQQLRQGWNLAQFDLRLSVSRRGVWLPRAWRMLRRDPAWRAVRWSLAALAAVQLIGLNALAWQERRQLQAQQAEMRGLLGQAFPEVRLVLDAPRQMRAELERLRQQQGELGGQDFESLLGAIGAGATAAGLQRIDYHPAQARLSGWQPSEAGLAALDAAGWSAQQQGSDWLLGRK